MSTVTPSDRAGPESLSTLRAATRQSREDARESIAALGSTLGVSGEHAGSSEIAGKIRVARTVFGFVRRHPVSTVVVAGAALVVWNGLRRAHRRSG